VTEKKTALASDIEAMASMFGGQWNSYHEIQHREHVKHICDRWKLLSETTPQRNSLSQDAKQHFNLKANKG
jgi:hypothetical protein